MLTSLMRGALLCALLAFSTCSVPAYGCAGMIPVIRDVATVVSWLTGKADQIEQHVKSMTDSGLLPADVAPRVKALRDLIERVDHATELAPDAYEALVAEVQSAWKDLLLVTGRYGVQAAAPDQQLLGAPRGKAFVPTMAEVGAKLREEK